MTLAEIGLWISLLVVRLMSSLCLSSRLHFLVGAHTITSDRSLVLWLVMALAFARWPSLKHYILLCPNRMTHDIVLLSHNVTQRKRKHCICTFWRILPWLRWQASKAQNIANSWEITPTLIPKYTWMHAEGLRALYSTMSVGQWVPVLEE